MVLNRRNSSRSQTIESILTNSQTKAKEVKEAKEVREAKKVKEVREWIMYYQIKALMHLVHQNLNLIQKNPKNKMLY